MSLHGLNQNTLGHEEVVLRRTSNGLGISYAGLEGTLGGEKPRIVMKVIIPQKVHVNVRFSLNQGAVS